MVFWTCGRQTLLAASTAEAELVAMGEAHAMMKALLPTIEALSEDSAAEIEPILYVDNSAALQLCTLDAGSWRTRHLRLRGGLIRQSVEVEGWKARLDGVYMCADVGTKPVGPARFADLVGLMGLDCPGMDEQRDPPNPKAARMRVNNSKVSKALIALLILSQLQVVAGQDTLVEVGIQGAKEFCMGVVWGLGVFVGWRVGERCERAFRVMGAHEQNQDLRSAVSPSLDSGGRDRVGATDTGGSSGFSRHLTFALSPSLDSGGRDRVGNADTGGSASFSGHPTSAMSPSLDLGSRDRVEASGSTGISRHPTSATSPSLDLGSRDCVEASGSTGISRHPTSATSPSLDLGSRDRVEASGSTGISRHPRSAMSPSLDLRSRDRGEASGSAGSSRHHTVTTSLSLELGNGDQGEARVGARFAVLTTGSSIDSEGRRENREESDDSGRIDERPHRPPPPVSDFERYQEYIAGLTDEEYHAMFYDGLFESGFMLQSSLRE